MLRAKGSSFTELSGPVHFEGRYFKPGENRFYFRYTSGKGSVTLLGGVLHYRKRLGA
jgi:hypothetical protein